MSIIGNWHRYLASAFRIHQRHTPLVTLLTLSYSIKPLIRTTLFAFSFLLIPCTHATNSPHDTSPSSAPAFPFASHQAPIESHPPELRPHPLQSPSSLLLSLLTPRSHLPRFHLPSFFPASSFPNTKPSQSRAPNSPIRALRAPGLSCLCKRPPLAL